jgi:hypothetical protein
MYKTIKTINDVKNSREHENVAFMSSRPLYTVICYIEVPFKAGLIVYENTIMH